jgi:hypothetical protein
MTFEIQALFGMNVTEISPGSEGTLPHYFAIALPFTFAIAWVFSANGEDSFEENANPFRRLIWPIYFLIDMIRQRTQKNDGLIGDLRRE